jgi:hypothetical protein
MRRVTMVVMGNGKTTRSNVEALLSDIIDSADLATLAVVYDKTMPEGAVWADQFCEEKLGSTEKYENNDYESLLKNHAVGDLRFFILWDDEDPDCQLAASVAQQNGISAFDLTDGLMMISLKTAKIEAPTVSTAPLVESVIEQEIVEEKTELPLLTSSTEVLDEDDYEAPAEEYDLPELITALVEQAGKELARSFFDEFKKLLDEQ